MFFQFIFFSLLNLVHAQSIPKIQITPQHYRFDYTSENGFDNGDSLSRTYKIMFRVELSDFIICPSQRRACMIILNFSSSDPRISAPSDLIWNSTENFEVYSENRTFNLTYVPDGHCKTGFVGSGQNVVETSIQSDSELYKGYNPYLNITLPPTTMNQYRCEENKKDEETNYTALYIVLIVLLVVAVIVAIFYLSNIETKEVKPKANKNLIF